VATTLHNVGFADEKTAMLQEFAHFHPKLIEIIKLADHFLAMSSDLVVVN